MSEGKVDPERVALRAPPRPITRLNRRSIGVLVGLITAAALGATLWSLQPRTYASRHAASELHNVDRVARAEGLEQLPPDYSKLRSPVPTPPPVLGPPLPGDLGGPMLRAQQTGATADSNGAGFPAAAPAAQSIEDARRAEQLNRQREAEEAAKAPIFFRSSRQRSDSVSEPAVRANMAAGTPMVNTPADASANASLKSPGMSSDAQEHKESFVSRAVDASTRNTHALQAPLSPYQIVAGTVISAALVTGIESDLPGQAIASVTEPVYDSATGEHLLIPQGSRLIGQYDSQVTAGQRRVLLVWTRLVLPDTSSLVLDRLGASDAAGNAGLEDRVDRHWGQLFAGAALSTLVGVGAQLAAPDRGSGSNGVVIAARGSVQDSINQVGQEVTRRNVNVPPTLSIRAGAPLRVIVNKDLMLRPIVAELDATPK